MLIERLAIETGLKPKQLDVYIRTASKRYFLFEIRKRDGSPRSIAHPAKPIKALQRWLNSRLLSNWNVHPCATAYKTGSSIKENALRHKATNFTLRVDFQDFFPSFKAEGIRNFLNSKIDDGQLIDEGDVEKIVAIMTRNSELTIGAPTSPHLTNVMMHEFDTALHALSEQHGVIYTRYADDIFLSTNSPGILNSIYNELFKIAENYPFAKLKINEQKTKFLSKKYRRSVTGIVLTSDGGLSIGRNRKREIKSLIHSFSVGILPIDKLEYLKGLLAFTFDCDILFFDSLLKKYGSEVIYKLIGSPESIAEQHGQAGVPF